MAKVIVPEEFRTLENDKSYLVLIHPETIPHLALIVNNKYYSLTYLEAEIGLDAPQLLTKLIRANKKLLLLELKQNITQVAKVFAQFESVDTSRTSCFIPVKQLLIPNSQAEMVHQLIPELYEAQFIAKSYHKNLENLLNKNGDFELRSYTKEMIFSYIQALKNNHARRK